MTKGRLIPIDNILVDLRNASATSDFDVLAQSDVLSAGALEEPNYKDRYVLDSTQLANLDKDVIIYDEALMYSADGPPREDTPVSRWHLDSVSLD